MIGSTLTRFHQGHFLPVDVETEGLNLFHDRPWQIAWGKWTPKGGLTEVKNRHIWWPDLRISAGAAAKTRFNYEAYKALALPARQVYDEFNSDRADPKALLLWQNGLGLDAYAIATWERAIGVEPSFAYINQEFRTIDLNAILKAIIKGWQPDTSTPEAFLAWQYRMLDYIEKGLKTNLTAAGKARQIEHDYDNTHDAANDIALMCKVFSKALFELEF